MNPQDADDRLADAIWWLTGFEAATARLGCAMDMSEGPSRGLADGLRSVRDRLRRLSTGTDRLIGTNCRAFSIAVTEAEFEVILDGLQRNTEAEQAAGLEQARKIFAEFRHEITSALDPEAPF